MRIIKPATLHGWIRLHPTAGPGLRNWLKVARAASWSDINGVRGDFGRADPVRVASGNTVTVFDIGNGFRLVASVRYRSWTVYLLLFMTHAEYDKGVAKKVDGKPGKWRDNL